MFYTILPVLYLSVSFHPLGGHAKWPPHVNRRRAPGVIWLGFTGYAKIDNITYKLERSNIEI